MQFAKNRLYIKAILELDYQINRINSLKFSEASSEIALIPCSGIWKAILKRPNFADPT